MNTQAVTLLFTPLFGFILGLFVYFKNRKSAVNVSWALLSFSVGAWSLGLYYSTLARVDYQLALYANRLCNVSASFIATFFLNFVYNFAGIPKEKRKFLKLGYALNLFFILLIPTPLFVKSVSPKLYFLHYPEPGLFYPLYTFFFFFFISYGHYLLFKALRETAGVKHNQIKYVLIGTLPAFLGGSTTFLLVYNIPVSPFPFTHMVPFYLFVITYAIVKHQLMDINIIIKKSLIYSILAAMLTIVFFLLVFMLEHIFKGVFGYRSLIASLFVALGVATAFIPLRNFLQNFLDKYFFKGTQPALAEQLERAHQELRRAEQLKAVGTLAAGLAHEIKNPLTSIKTFTEHLEAKFDNPEFRGKFRRIVGQEVDKINGLVKQLLDFAKPAPLALREVDVQMLLDDVLNLLSNDFLKHNIYVDKDYKNGDSPNFLRDVANGAKNLGQSPFLLKVDIQQMKQVILNLCLNAIEAMEDDGGVLRVTAGRVDEGIEIVISDSGRGIEPEKLGHIFDPFYSTKEKGTGLGLSIVYSIIKEHGGRIEVESAAGKGTRFTVTLPVS